MKNLTLSKTDCIIILKDLFSESPFRIKNPSLFKKIYYSLCYMQNSEKLNNHVDTQFLEKFYSENKNNINRKKIIKSFSFGNFYYKIKKEMRREKIF